MRTDLFDYDLPPDRIAQSPPARRTDARMLVLARGGGPAEHCGIRDLPEFLRAGDLLVVNDTRVLPARLFGRRTTGGRVELLLLEPLGAGRAWIAMVRCGGRLLPGEEVALTDGEEALAAGGFRMGPRRGGGVWEVTPMGQSFPDLMERAGKMPLPPYVRRERQDPRDGEDRRRYQTVFAREPGAVAAPTAGLHFDEALLDEVERRGVGVARVTLHVGAGTFLPVTVDDLDDHAMHHESYFVSAGAAAAVRRTRAEGGRVVAVGTTTVRTLEASAAGAADGLPEAGEGRTDLFIRPGHEFRAVDALVTNFHLPRSTLLCLVSAMVGRERLLAAYGEAVAAGYRFYSYGDCMLVL